MIRPRVRARLAAVAAVAAIAAGGVAAGAEPALAEPTTGRQCSVAEPALIPPEPAALDRLGVPAAWELATGRGVTVSIVDSGIAVGNAHLRDAVVGGASFGFAGPATDDVLGHGTVIAGIIAARRVADSGVIGVAPDARLLAARAFQVREENNDGLARPSVPSIAERIRWSVANGADIINVSLSVDRDAPALASAVAEARAAGVLIVASAGNRATVADPDNPPTAFYPAEYPGVLSVSAVDQAGEWDPAASFAGPHVDVVAPGSEVASAFFDAGDCVFGGAPSSSWATGYVSAVAALVAEAHPDESPDEWAYRITATALRPSPDARSDETGWGEVRPLEAISFLDDGTSPGPDSPSHPRVEPTPEALPPIELAEREDPLAIARGVVLGSLMIGGAVSLVAILVGQLGRRRALRAARR